MRIKARLPEILAGLSVLAIISLMIHQKLVHGFWFHPRGSWHHEAVEGCFAALAIGLLLGNYLGRKYKG